MSALPCLACAALLRSGCVCARVCVGESSLTPPLQQLRQAECSDWPSQSSRSICHACASPRCFSRSLSLTRFLTGCTLCMPAIIVITYHMELISFLSLIIFISPLVFNFLHFTLLVVLRVVLSPHLSGNLFYCFLLQAALTPSNNLFHGYFWHTKSIVNQMCFIIDELCSIDTCYWTELNQLFCVDAYSCIKLIIQPKLIICWKCTHP